MRVFALFFAFSLNKYRPYGCKDIIADPYKTMIGASTRARHDNGSLTRLRTGGFNPLPGYLSPVQPN